ncbi:MAG: hypothetical protein GWO20_17375 [Candidatus Korarchaeota archaeon]|nr:hypothetical protein [Candidatus Korarchaeota archaeon]NIU81999.1 hypothetical protein [Candidatus Thorarchaeota archaeon]NIW15167.1 hypothetical protein [Candidatus Thorarchaeota archaeon]NIW53157.1 hypothetical protein [Candidatus Korarchaeota archaeon]
MPSDELLEALLTVIDSLDSKKGADAPSIKTKMKKLEKIYSIGISAGPTEAGWKTRIIEELRAFKAMKNTAYGDLLPHFRYLTPYQKKNQFLLVQTKRNDNVWEWGLIRLPLFYPSLPPSSIHSKSGELKLYTKHTDSTKCLGGIIADRWNRTGDMGVAHWLCFCEVFLSLRDSPIKV